LVKEKRGEGGEGTRGHGREGGGIVTKVVSSETVKQHDEKQK